MGDWDVGIGVFRGIGEYKKWYLVKIRDFFYYWKYVLGRVFKKRIFGSIY
jgi:hypothetical protein